jgi:hypothetical protein
LSRALTMVTGPSRTAPALAAAAGVVALAGLASTSEFVAVAALIALLCVVALVRAHALLLSWHMLVSGIVLIILLIPIRRYALPGSLPFQLEPYRIAVALIVVVWVGCMLIQPDTRFRRSGLDGPVFAFVLAVGLSVAANVPRIHALDVQPEVTKRLTFFASFLIVLYLCASVIGRGTRRDALLAVLAAGGTVLAVAAIVEARTGFNPFDHLHKIVPVLDQTAPPLHDRVSGRGGRLRAYASAQHSIALGAALAMLLPFACYLAQKTGRRAWWGCAIVLTLGALSTVSRTAALMLMVEVITLLVLKPQLARRLWPMALPFVVVMHVAMPGTLGAFKGAFFPEGGLIAEQKQGAGTYGSGRIADLGPGLAEWSQKPLFGQGFGTRVSVRTDPKWNAPILDNQWLNLLLETGIAGVLAIAWILIRTVRRMGRASRRAEDDADSWLLAAFTAAIAAFGVGMFTYDAFAFIQVTFVLFILLGLAAPELRAAAAERRRVAALPRQRGLAASPA